MKNVNHCKKNSHYSKSKVFEESECYFEYVKVTVNVLSVEK